MTARPWLNSKAEPTILGSSGALFISLLNFSYVGPVSSSSRSWILLHLSLGSHHSLGFAWCLHKCCPFPAKSQPVSPDPDKPEWSVLSLREKRTHWNGSFGVCCRLVLPLVTIVTMFVRSPCFRWSQFPQRWTRFKNSSVFCHLARSCTQD